MILRGLYGVWIIGCVACLNAFLFVFFSSRKTVFKSLLDTSSTLGYLSSFQVFFFLIAISTLGESIKKVSISSIASWQLGRSIELLLLIWWFVSRHLQLSTVFLSTPTSTDVSTPLDTFICQDLLRLFFNSSCDLLLISVDLPLDYSAFHLPILSHSLQSSSSRFLQAFSSLSSLGKLLISHIHAFHVLKPRIWGFWKFLGIFKIVEFLLKFWVVFWRFDLKNFMHCITFTL